MQRCSQLFLWDTEQAQVFKDYNRNEEKHKKRALRCHDPRGYLEGQEWSQQALNYISSGLEMDDVLNSVYLKVAYNQLSPIQKIRLSLYFFCGLPEEKIAEIGGVSQVAVHKSIVSAIESMRFMLDLDNK